MYGILNRSGHVQDFAKGQFQNKSEGFNRLMKNYTSEVSPDRKGIITPGLKAVSGNRQNVPKPIDLVATLLEREVKYQKLPSGNCEYIEFYDKNGEMVATYSNQGWKMYTTNAEDARQKWKIHCRKISAISRSLAGMPGFPADRGIEEGRL